MVAPAAMASSKSSLIPMDRSLKGGEESKSGFSPQALYAAAESAREFSHIRVLGLMAIPPADVNAGGDGRLAGGGIIHLAGPHQEDLPRVPARRPGGPVHPLPDGYWD